MRERTWEQNKPTVTVVMCHTTERAFVVSA
jgi:hypothetical protein